MEFSLERAREAELPALLMLCHRAARAPGSHWDAEYPNLEILREDLRQGGLYRIVTRVGETVGLIGLGDLGELRALPWPETPGRAAEAARFCLDAPYQGRGLGLPAFRAAAEYGREQGYSTLRFLVARDDMRLRKLYESAGARSVGACTQWGGEYAQYVLPLEP